MNRSIIYLTLFTFPIMLNAQVTQVKFKQEWSFDNDFSAEQDSNEIAELTDADIQDIKENQEELIQFMTGLSEKVSAEILTYTSSNSVVRFERPISNPDLFFSDEFILIDRASRVMNHYYTHNKRGPEKSEIPLDRSKFREIKVEYEIDTISDSRKKILGYDCYKVEINEHIRDLEDNSVEEYHYELYVTDEIDLPFHLLNSTVKPVLNSCSLETKVSKIGYGRTYSKMTAIEIVHDLNSNYVELPDKFRIK